MTTIEFRQFEMTLISAKDLLDVRHFSDMRVYAKVSVKGVPDTKIKTSIDKKGATNPCWNSKMVFYIDEATIRKKDVVFSIKLYCHRTFNRDKYVGEVNISLRMLSDNFGVSHERLRFTVDRDGYKGTFGTLDVSYALGDPFMVEVGKDSTGKVEFKTNEGDIGHCLLKGATKIVIEAATEIVIEGAIEAAAQMVTEGVIEGATQMVTESVMEGATEIVMEVATEIVMEVATEIVMEGAAQIAVEVGKGAVIAVIALIALL